MFKLGAACWDNCQTTPLSSLSNPAPSTHYSFCKTVLPLLSIRFRLLCCACDQGVLTNQQVWIWNLASAALCSMLVDHNCACGGWGSSGHAGVGIADYTMLRRVTQCRHHRLHSVTQCGQRASAAERTGSVHLRALLHLFPVLASDFHRSRLVSLSFCLSVSQWFDYH